ncbi:hypothetical protein HY024_01310 [Candidatus Curtissbacteria bacterium]|nr:hypothetical protein [Candidatus Curtissbacteria bacterium]
MGDRFTADCFVPDPGEIAPRRQPKLADILVPDQSHVPDERATFNGQPVRVGIQNVYPFPRSVEAAVPPQISESGVK